MIPSFERDNVIGLEDEALTITNYILEPTDELDVISIIGMAGLGKTTLAWKIYNSKEITDNYVFRIWFYVSENPILRSLLLTILAKFTRNDMSRFTDDQLTEKVRKNLGGRKFLLVFDDVWKDTDWDAIKNMLPMNNKAGKVVITSRENKVGIHANPARKPHKLRFLHDDESWTLLQLRVFGKKDECPEELARTGFEIAKQCKGLPLAIVVIAGVLLDHYSRTQTLDQVNEEWAEVKKNVGKHIVDSTSSIIDEILEMSYKRLPDHLRDCFLYLGVFPEDYKIQARTLIHLWIAEGFVIRKQNETLETTAEKNLWELIDRNLVMIDKLNPNNKVKTCRVHDLVRAFSIRRATGDQEMYQHIVKSRERDFHPRVEDIPNNYRRLCINSDLEDILNKQPEGPHVRSLLIFQKEPLKLDPIYTPQIPNSFKLLRVLDSACVTFNKFPDKLTHLIHLRYIAVSCDDINVLPKSFSELWNLHTFVVNTTSGLLTVEANIWMLRQLRHVITRAAIVLPTIETKASSSSSSSSGESDLQTLSCLSPGSCTDDVFKKASSLKKLGVRGKLATLFVDGKSLKELSHLEKLKLVNDEDPSNVFPNIDFFPLGLVRLTITRARLDWKHMSILAQMKNLRVLKLKEKAFSGESWKGVGEGFCKLNYLLIQDADFAVWDVETGYLKTLETLVLKNCENLIGIPKAVTGNLKLLDVDCVSDEVLKSAEKIKEGKDANSFKLIRPSYVGK